MDYGQLSNGTLRQAFIADAASGLATSLGVARSQVFITGLRAASVVLDFTVVSLSASAMPALDSAISALLADPMGALGSSLTSAYAISGANASVVSFPPPPSPPPSHPPPAPPSPPPSLASLVRLG